MDLPGAVSPEPPPSSDKSALHNDLSLSRDALGGSNAVGGLLSIAVHPVEPAISMPRSASEFAGNFWGLWTKRKDGVAAPSGNVSRCSPCVGWLS